MITVILVITNKQRCPAAPHKKIFTTEKGPALKQWYKMCRTSLYIFFCKYIRNQNEACTTVGYTALSSYVCYQASETNRILRIFDPI